MLRRAQIPMAMSQGFNPRPKMIFASALGVGIEGRCEVVDLELSDAREPSELLTCLRTVAPSGFDWKDARPLPDDARPPRPLTVEYCVPVPAHRRIAAELSLQSLLSSATWPFKRRRPGRESTFDLRPQLTEAELSAAGLLRFRLKVSTDGSARPEELLEALALRDLLDCGAVLSRTDVEVHG